MEKATPVPNPNRSAILWALFMVLVFPFVMAIITAIIMLLVKAVGGTGLMKDVGAGLVVFSPLVVILLLVIFFRKLVASLPVKVILTLLLAIITVTPLTASVYLTSQIVTDATT